MNINNITYPRIINEEAHFGLVKKHNRYYVRNYKRPIKNGETELKALYECAYKNFEIGGIK